MIDQSGSMSERDVRQPGSGRAQSRWMAAAEGTQALAAGARQLDPDGIMLYTYSRNFTKQRVCSAARFKQVFMEKEPLKGTNLCAPLNDAIDEFFHNCTDRKQVNSATVLVVIDGVWC